MILLAMVMLIEAGAGRSEKVQACVRAVHTDPAAAVLACAIPKGAIQIFDKDQPDWLPCERALANGESVGRSGGKLPAIARDALVRNFDRMIAACTGSAKSTEPSTPVSTRHSALGLNGPALPAPPVQILFIPGTPTK